MELRNGDSGETVVRNLREASTFLSRFRGLMFTKSLKDDCALLIRPCRSVHTFFMKYPIDVLYLDARNVVIGCDERLMPYRIGSMLPQARSVVELPAGRVREAGIRIGHRLEFY